MSPPRRQPRARDPARPPAFEVERELGHGATGHVDLAHLTEPFGDWPEGTRVAVKRLRAEHAADRQALEAFAAEAAAGSAVRDPSLVRVVHQGADDEGPFIVMEYVEGRSLREALDEDGPLPEPLLRHVGAQLAGALAALHGAGLVHGDVKPDNVRLAPDGRAVLVDLGFATAAPADARGDLAAATGPGSLPYLSPERARGSAPDEASDVFALGLSLYEAAVGGHPLLAYAASPSGSGTTAVGGASRLAGAALAAPTPYRPLLRSIEDLGADRLLADLVAARFAPASRLAPHLSPFVDRVLADCLQQRAARRPTAAALAEILRGGEAGPWWRDRLVSERKARGGRPERPPERPMGQHMTPLVGRDVELARLLQIWGTAGAGDGAVVVVRGPAGSGHSRLVTEFVDRARAGGQPPVHLYTRCTELVESRPHGALLVLLHRWLQLPPGAEPGERERERLHALVAPQTAETLMQMLSPGFRGESSSSVSQALVAWLVALADERRLILFVDDLRHAQELTLRTLAKLARRISGHPLLLVIALRDDQEPDHPESLQHLWDQLDRLALGRPPLLYERVDLGPIDREAVLELVSALFHNSAPRLRLAEQLWKRSRGNPGLLSEVLRNLIASGVAHPAGPDDAALVLDVDPARIPMPTTLQHTIAKRYRALEPAQRLWLERLAVVGGRIAPDFLVRAFPPTSLAEIGEVLARLTHKGWLAPAGPRYRFARPALREAVYRSLSRDRRRRLHTAAARALEPRAGMEPTATESFQRVFHLRAAGEHRELLGLLGPLVRSQREAGQPQRVYSLARWGLEALADLPESAGDRSLALEFLEAAADAADRMGLRERERELLDRMADMDIDPEVDPHGSARVYLLHGRYAVGTGQYGLARGMLRNAVELAHAAGDAALASDCLRRLSLVQSHVGELAEALQLAREAVRHASSPLQMALAWLARAQAEILDDEVESALASVGRAIEIQRHADRPAPLGVQAAALMLRGRVLRAAGQPPRAFASMSRALRLAQQSGERRLEAEAGARLGALLLDLDRPDEAEARLRDAMLTADEIEDRRGRALSGVWLGLLLWERDDPESVSVLERAVATAGEMGYYRAESVGQSILARIHRVAGELRPALDRSGRAVELLDRHGAELLDRIVILGSRALVLDSAGRRSEARALVRGLRRRMRQENAAISDASLRRPQRAYTTRLLETVLSPEGPVSPRIAR